jgi:hypothetical protein
MKRLLIGLMVLAAALPVMAQEGPIGEGAQEIVIRYLELTPDQVATWDQLIDDFEADAEPLREAIAEIQAQIDELFANGSPDPYELGELVIQRRDLVEQLAQVRETYVFGFESLLDEQQAKKLNVIRRADRVEPLIPAFRVYGLLPRY